jgi:hypothetical protein
MAKTQSRSKPEKFTPDPPLSISALHILNSGIQMTDISCASGNDNRMVIAISNGEININDPFR